MHPRVPTRYSGIRGPGSTAEAISLVPAVRARMIAIQTPSAAETPVPGERVRVAMARARAAIAVIGTNHAKVTPRAGAATREASSHNPALITKTARPRARRTIRSLIAMDWLSSNAGSTPGPYA